MKKIFFSFVVIFFTLGLFSQNALYQKILDHRLQNSSVAKKIQNEVLIAENNFNMQRLNSYIVAELGTGGMNFNFTENGVDYNLSPTAKISLPSFANTAFSISLPISKVNNKSSTGGDPNSSFGVDLNLSFDLYSKSFAEKKLERKNAERLKNATTEKLKYTNSILEKELLSDLNNLFESYLEYLNKQLASVTANINFKKIEIEGYSKISVRYKASQLKALSAEKQAITSEKFFKGKLEKFFRTTGLDQSKILDEDFQKSMEKFFEDLSFSIPEKNIIKVDDLKLENSNAFKTAKEDYHTKIEQGKIQNSNFSVSATTGFSHKKTKIANTSQMEKINSFNAGLAFNFPGGSLFSGVTLNFADIKHPSLNLSLAFNPLDIYYKKLISENTKLQNEIARIDFEAKAEESEMLILDLKTRASNFQMSLENSKYEYKIYEQNAIDIKKLYDDGYITRLDNAQANLEYQQSLVGYAQAKANIINFNIQIMQDFDILVEEQKDAN